MNKIILECQNLKKTFHDGVTTVEVLSNVNLKVHAGERVAIIGASGEGKSTLLHILGGLERPTHGNVYVEGINLHQLNEAKRCATRNQKLGFVYQFHHLLPEFTALENVSMPLLLRGEAKTVVAQRAQAILTKVGLAHRLAHKPNQLSGGERQRVAIARALVTHPLCVLADEPTGNLDHQTAIQVYQTMLQLNHDLNTSLLIVTHDVMLAKQMNKVYRLQAGQLITESEEEIT